jgi:hypothetical protein
VYISDLAHRNLEEDFFVLLFGKPISISCVKRSSDAENVLEIDVSRAWEESEQRAGWSNEVAVELIVR